MQSIAKLIQQLRIAKSSKLIEEYSLCTNVLIVRFFDDAQESMLHQIKLHIERNYENIKYVAISTKKTAVCSEYDNNMLFVGFDEK